MNVRRAGGFIATVLRDSQDLNRSCYSLTTLPLTFDRDLFGALALCNLAASHCPLVVDFRRWDALGKCCFERDATTRVGFRAVHQNCPTSKTFVDGILKLSLVAKRSRRRGY